MKHSLVQGVDEGVAHIQDVVAEHCSWALWVIKCVNVSALANGSPTHTEP